jgi:hypothetical protein
MSQESSDFGILQSIVGSWYESLKNPEQYQDIALKELLEAYGKTRYGQIHKASEIKTIENFKRMNFPHSIVCV